MSTSLRLTFQTECRQAFRLFDKDDDGSISASEIKTVMLSMGKKQHEFNAHDMIREVDNDGMTLEK